MGGFHGLVDNGHSREPEREQAVHRQQDQETRRESPEQPTVFPAGEVQVSTPQATPDADKHQDGANPELAQQRQ